MKLYSGNVWESRDFFPLLLWSIFFNCIPFKARCALSIFPMLKQCAGRGKQVWGSVLTKGKGLVKREEPLALVNPGSCTGLNRQKLPLHRKIRMGTHDGRRRMQLKKVRNSIKQPSEIPLSHTPRKKKRLPTLTSKQPRNHKIKKT